MNDTPILSIFVPTYNHEYYIKRALDSILMQKTEYSYEVLVGEDVSTDSTRDVLKEYERQHPGKITVFYREKNMNKMPVWNSLDLKLRARGKYLIGLEGDDFWIDGKKIKKQVDFLETHPEYIAVAHNCVVVGADSEPNGETYPECKDAEYTFEHFYKRIMPGQFTTVMSRNYMSMEDFDRTLVTKNLTPGDQLLYFSLLCHGRIYCMQEAMSAYRHITVCGSSYSATVRFDYKVDIEWYRSLLSYAQKHCKKEIIKQCEILYIGCVVSGIKCGVVGPANLLLELKMIPLGLGKFFKYTVVKAVQKLSAR